MEKDPSVENYILKWWFSLAHFKGLPEGRLMKVWGTEMAQVVLPVNIEFGVPTSGTDSHL